MPSTTLYCPNWGCDSRPSAFEQVLLGGFSGFVDPSSGIIVLVATQAGYSGTPLAKKLGIQPNQRILLLSAPATVRDTLAPALAEAKLVTSLRGTRAFDVIVWFTRSTSELEARFGAAAARLEPAGGLWIAWPKKASKAATDITEDIVRRVALGQGLVDNKVCAVDAVWSGLRCVIRRENRRRG